MPQKPTILYELNTLVDDDLSRVTEELAEAAERSGDEVTRAVGKTIERYRRGELTQGEHWGEVALSLALEDLEVVGAVAQNTAEIDQELLGWIRGQGATSVLGLVSDATPDFVGHFRKTYQLDELLHVHVIGSELDEERDYPGLLTLSAERLQVTPAQVNFVARKPVQLAHAKALGMQCIDLGAVPDYKAAFVNLA